MNRTPSKTIGIGIWQKLGFIVAILLAIPILACRPSASSSMRTNVEGASETAANQDQSDQIFGTDAIHTIAIELTDAQAKKLNEDARQYVKCTLVENGGRRIVDVGLKLKGAAGSFQDLNGKPAFTLNVSKFRKGQSFYDLDKFHLNNSVQDELYTNEWLCSSICRDAGIPAPRISHARVRLNDRDLGLYVFKESFDRKFLQRHFPSANGNLYDGGFCQDIDVDLERDAGDGPRDFSDLRALQSACNEQDLIKRMEQMQQHLDLAAFRTFMAFEMMACHWDGYVANANNYRVYFSPATNRASFLPHGMDQMFQDPSFQTFGHTPSIVARAFREIPEWNALYRKRVEELLPFFVGDRLADRVRKIQRKLSAEIATFHPGGSAGVEEQFNDLIQRLKERHRQIAQQLTEPDPPIPEPGSDEAENLLEIGINESVNLMNFTSQQETESSIMEMIESPDGEFVYVIRIGDSNDCIASWRKSVLLPRGTFRFSADVRVQDVVERTNDERGRGAGLRISGVNRENGFVATMDWSRASYDFQTNEEQQVIQLVAELRAIHGAAEIKNPSITRIEP